MSTLAMAFFFQMASRMPWLFSVWHLFPFRSLLLRVLTGSWHGCFRRLGDYQHHQQKVKGVVQGAVWGSAYGQ
ncbi:hypothetical protein B0H65DRAFT_467350 [Neurospora tetraspora]|uniref:Uncharacterized protein n=1 Tax=Neurospora tetraspora TaxID=94610 RepID=A0AAE0MSI6_9PEZI|nr:hypothetical protein B0H65DRAFT_467350 [Neurospora tetraspora]